MPLKTWTYGPQNEILAFPDKKAAIGVQVNDTGVTADAATGKKIIPAGTPVGGTDSALEKEDAVLSVANDATAQGVLEHDVDVTTGQATGTLIIWGFINEYRMKNVTVSDDAKKALAGKVTFLKRNDM